MVSATLAAVIAVCVIASFAATHFAVPFVIENSRKAGITGRDQNKKKEQVPEMGGIAIVFGVSIGLVAAITLGFNSGLNAYLLLAALATTLMMGFLGIVDDLYALRRTVKAPIPFLSAAPLSAVRAGVSTMNFPLIGAVNLGSLYQLVAIPMGVGGASNAFNMLAGLNGLEAGMGIVISATIAIASFLVGSQESLVISASLAAALLAFLFFNRYPARVFPGDVGTYTIGATIASAVIIGNMEFLGVVLFAPYFIELALKARTRFRGTCFGVLRKDGTLQAPKKVESLTHVVMNLGRFREHEIVLLLVAAEAVIAAVGLYFFIYPIARY